MYSNTLLFELYSILIYIMISTLTTINYYLRLMVYRIIYKEIGFNQFVVNNFLMHTMHTNIIVNVKQ